MLLRRIATRLTALSAVFVLLLAGWTMPTSAATTYNSHLRRYPYLTDVVNSYATINWATDQYFSTGAVRWGQVGAESCTAHYTPASRIVVNVNGVLEYQWKAVLNLLPNTQYCYRVYLGSSPSTEIDLLGSDAAPAFWTQVPSGSTQSYSFIVFGDWGFVGASGTNTYQASLMSLIAQSGARFAVTAGDNAYPSGNQANMGDLIQTGTGISTIFGPSYWKVPGASLPVFLSSGNHGYTSAVTPALIVNFPQGHTITSSNGVYRKVTYCCLDGTTSANYPTIYYAIDAGLARIYFLDAVWSDTNIGTASSPYQVDYHYKWMPSSPEYQWLQNDLATHPSVLKFAVFHYPMYSDNGKYPSDPWLQGAGSLEGLLRQYGVDIAFQGHAHIYERNPADSDGLINYVTGGGGAPLGGLGACSTFDAYAIGFGGGGKSCGGAPVPTSPAQVYHFLKVTVNGANVTVTPINSLGNQFDVQSYSFSSGAESTPPTVPGGLAANAVGGRQVSLGWSASTDNTAVRGYDVYRNSQLIATTDASTLSYSDAGLAPGTSYSYTVDAFDGSGNHSSQATAAAVTTPKTATYVFYPVADSFVSSANPTTNYGTSGVMKAQSGSPITSTYLRFNVNGIVGAITNATLKLHTSTSSATGYQVRGVSDNTWEENQVTYNNAPAFGSVAATSGGFSSGTWVSTNATSLITGTGVFNLAITTSSTSNMSFSSRDAASNWPQLVLTTSVP